VNERFFSLLPAGKEFKQDAKDVVKNNSKVY
jgi:hypothetical protein